MSDPAANTTQPPGPPSGQPETLFTLMQGATSLRLEMTPRGLVTLVRSLTPEAITLLMAVLEDGYLNGDHPGPPGESGWSFDLGLEPAAAEDALAELVAKGYLDPSRPFRPQPRPFPPTPEVPSTTRVTRERCRACGGYRYAPTAPSVTYVVERDGYLKIGVTSNLSARLAALSKPGSPGVVTPRDLSPDSILRLLGTTTLEEHDLHERFIGCHVVGEWFKPSAAMSKEIRTLVKTA